MVNSVSGHLSHSAFEHNFLEPRAEQYCTSFFFLNVDPMQNLTPCGEKDMSQKRPKEKTYDIIKNDMVVHAPTLSQYFFFY